MVFFSDLPAVVKDFAGAGLQNYWYGPWLFKKHVENGVLRLFCNQSSASFLRQMPQL
jgi:hypothetical protein